MYRIQFVNCSINTLLQVNNSFIESKITFSLFHSFLCFVITIVLYKTMAGFALFMVVLLAMAGYSSMIYFFPLCQFSNGFVLDLFLEPKSNHLFYVVCVTGAAYCVCGVAQSNQVLQKNIDFACGNGADCAQNNADTALI